VTSRRNPPPHIPPPHAWGPQPHWQPPPPPPPPKRTLSVWALALACAAVLFGLVLGFVPFSVLLWLTAAVVSAVALRRVHSGKGAGRSMAVTALVLSCVTVLTMIVGSAASSIAPGGGAAPVIAPQPARTLTTAEWNTIARDPDSHAGERVVVHGTVSQADANTGPDMVLVSAGPAQTDPYDYSTTVVLRGDVAALSEGDPVHAEIEINGLLDYDTLIGGSNSAVDADLLVLR
jgi:hypothetical protein